MNLEELSDDQLLELAKEAGIDVSGGVYQTTPEPPSVAERAVSGAARGMVGGIPGMVAGAAKGALGLEETEQAGVTPMERALSSFKATPEGRAAFYKTKYGAGNVRQVGDEIQIQTGGRWLPESPSGIGLGDVASLMGQVPEMGGMLAGAAVGARGGPIGGVAGAGAGAVAGEAARQGIAELIPGEEEVTTRSRVANLAKAGIGGMAGEGLGRLAIKGLELANPANIIGSILRKYSSKLQQAEQLEKQTGVTLPLGEATGARGLQITESRLRANPITAGEFEAADIKNMQAINTRMDRLIDRITTTPTSDVSIGKSISETFDQGMKHLVNARATRADKDFMFLQGTLGEMPVFEVNALRGTLDDLLRQYGRPGSGMPAQGLVNEVRNLIAGLDKAGPGGRISAAHLQTLFQRYGEAGYGGGVNIFKALDKDANTRIAQQLHGALMRDIQSNAVSLGQSQSKRMQNVAKMLEDARSNYAAMSEPINEFAESALGKIVKSWDIRQGMEGLAKSVSVLPPSQMQATVSILNKMDPAVSAAVRRYPFERALEAARASGKRDLPLDLNTLLKELPDDKTMDVLIGSTGNTRKGIAQLIEAAERMGNTRGALMGQDPLMGIAKGAARMVLPGGSWLTVPSAIFAPKAMARIILDPGARQSLQTIVTARAPTRAVLKSAAYLNAWYATHGEEE